MNETDFHARLVEKIQSFSDGGIEGLTAEDKLVSTGLIDSMNIVELIVLVEQYWDLRVEPTELSVDNFDSVAAITRYVRHKLHSEL